jgi:toxin ParE1/3/4
MNVEWSETALRHLRQLRDYIAENNPTAAAQLAARLLESTTLLAQFPASGRAGRIPHTRELVVSGAPYIVAYRVKDEVVEIAAVNHGARKRPREV